MHSMQVYFNPNVSFRAQNTSTKHVDVNTVKAQTPVVVQPEPPAKKKSGLIEGISNIAKFFANFSEMTKATIKGTGYGLLTSAGVAFGFWSLESLPKAVQQKSLETVLKNPLKAISTKGKVLTAIAGLGVASYHLIKGKLSANQRMANVEHKLQTGHNA